MADDSLVVKVVPPVPNTSKSYTFSCVTRIYIKNELCIGQLVYQTKINTRCSLAIVLTHFFPLSNITSGYIVQWFVIYYTFSNSFHSRTWLIFVFVLCSFHARFSCFRSFSFFFWWDRRMHNLCVARNPNGERNGIYQCLTFYLHFLNNESQDVRTVHSSINNDLPFQLCIWKSGHHKQIRVRRKSTRYSLHSIFSEIIRVGGGEGHTSETQE